MEGRVDGWMDGLVTLEPLTKSVLQYIRKVVHTYMYIYHLHTQIYRGLKHARTTYTYIRNDTYVCRTVN